MPDIRKFGPGNRRADPPPNTTGIHPAILLNEEFGFVAELYFEPGGDIWEHSSEDLILFVVIDGKGWVRVDGEESEVSTGDAVLWPPDRLHKAWTEQSFLSAIVVHYKETREDGL